MFLARGCGELTVEMCPGIYGKELFLSLKRAGHHAKHEVVLMKWPVYTLAGWEGNSYTPRL